MSSLTHLSASCSLMSELARKRWRLLGDVLANRLNFINSDLASASVRRFASFGLFSLLPCTELVGDDSSQWYTYTCQCFPHYQAAIRHLDSHVKLNDLLGFNNTGNVCVWPSEEVLAYYCLRHADKFQNQTVCELGGGMTCLAAVTLAVSCNVSEVWMTDGNEQSVANIEQIIEKNKNNFCTDAVHTRLLRWGRDVNLEQLEGHFDFVISADCLFFDEARTDLIQTIFRLLKPRGEAVIMAPRRGQTFQQFVDAATEKLFKADICYNYDDTVWTIHTQNVSKGVEVYDEMIHYPVLLRLTKQ